MTNVEVKNCKDTEINDINLCNRVDKFERIFVVFEVFLKLNAERI